MPETLTDEQILGLDDGPSSEVSSETPAAPESAELVETQPEETAEETQLRPEQTKPETQTQTKQPAKAQQPAKEGTPEQAHETIAAKAAELDRTDAAFANGDIAGMAETFEQMFGENPAGLTDAMWMGYRFLEQRAPEQFSNFSRMIVADQLTQLGAWGMMERIAATLQKTGDRATFAELNKLAVVLRQNYGLGPSTPETQTSALQNYTRQVGSMMERSVPALIRSTFGERFSSLQPTDQEELVKAGNLAISDLLRKDQAFGAAMQQLAKGYSDKEGLRVWFDVLEPRLRSIIPRVVRHLENQHGDLFKNIPVRPQPAARAAQTTKPAVAAPRSMAEARSRNMNLRDILKSVEGDIANGSFLTQDDANALSDREILDSQRIPQPRKPWRPESILDEATP